MRNGIMHPYKSGSAVIQQDFLWKYLATIPIALVIAIGIGSWQESTSNYWQEFNTVRVKRLRQQKGIAVGELAPPFRLRSKDGKQIVTLQSLGEKPVVLIFGSHS